MIGIERIKQRRLRNELHSHTGLYVGDCVPFFFCVRPPMLYAIHHRTDQDLRYEGGQDQLVYLEVRLHRLVGWADDEERRWAFTTSNAGAIEFHDYADLEQLHLVHWDAVLSSGWVPPELKDDRQAEFLVEHSCPWQLVHRVGVRSQHLQEQVCDILAHATHQPEVNIRADWYI